MTTSSTVIEIVPAILVLLGMFMIGAIFNIMDRIFRPPKNYTGVKTIPWIYSIVQKTWASVSKSSILQDSPNAPVKGNTYYGDLWFFPTWESFRIKKTKTNSQTL